MAVVVAMGVLAWSGTALAGNGLKPRILVDWSGAPCMTIVDRSAQASINLPYSIALEDTELTEDEVEDSRRHQFFGFCRSYPPNEFLPRWITQADVDRAAMVGAGPQEVDAEDILESNAAWADCWVRINEDDDRKPITFPQATMGIDWDTTAAPAGTYLVEGYTWEPAINEWSNRPGVVKVVDGPDPALSGPALAINDYEIIANRNETVTVQGCASAEPDSTITAFYSLAGDGVEWTPFIEDDPLDGETFAVELTPPEALVGESSMIRIDIEDPSGRQYTNYMRGLLIVLESDGPGECDDGGFIGGAGCEEPADGSGTHGGGEDGDGSTTGPSPTSGGADGTGSETPGGPGGCACHSAGGGTAPWGGLLLLLWGWRRRRVAAG